MTEYRVKAIRRSTPEELAAHEQRKADARAYAVKRAKQQNPDVEFNTWEEMMALPMNALKMDTFNELLESGLVETQEKDEPRVQKIEKKKK